MRVVLNFMASVQLGPVKKRFIGVASWLRGRDVQIGLIKNPPRALLRKRGLSESPLAKYKMPFSRLLVRFLEQDLQALGMLIKYYTS